MEKLFFYYTFETNFLGRNKVLPRSKDWWRIVSECLRWLLLRAWCLVSIAANNIKFSLCDFKSLRTESRSIGSASQILHWKRGVHKTCLVTSVVHVSTSVRDIVLHAREIVSVLIKVRNGAANFLGWGVEGSKNASNSFKSGSWEFCLFALFIQHEE